MDRDVVEIDKNAKKNKQTKKKKKNEANIQPSLQNKLSQWMIYYMAKRLLQTFFTFTGKKRAIRSGQDRPILPLG